MPIPAVRLLGHFPNYRSSATGIGGGSYLHIMGLNHGSLKPLVPHGIGHCGTSFDIEKPPTPHWSRKLSPELHFQSCLTKNELRSARLCYTESLMPLKYFQKSQPYILKSFPQDILTQNGHVFFCYTALVEVKDFEIFQAGQMSCWVFKATTNLFVTRYV